MTLRFALVAGFVTALAAVSALAQADNVIHEERSLYRNIYVTDDGDEVCMRFRASRFVGRQSCQRKSDPDELVFEYARMMLASLYVIPEPKRILIVGLGGGTLPSALQELLPDAEIDVVELDGAVDRIARRYFDFKPGPKMRVFIEDGRVFVKRMGRQAQAPRYDLVMLDAFEDDYIPEHLLTREFLQEVQAILAPGGVVAANTFSNSALYDYESVTYQSVFDTLFSLKAGNRILIARHGELPSMDVVRANAAEWEEAFNRRKAYSRELLPLFTTAVDWDPNTRVLTDQYSPSNVLNARRRDR